MNVLRKLYDIFQFGVDERPEWFSKAINDEKAYEFDTVAFIKRCDDTWRVVHHGDYIFNRRDFEDMIALTKESGEFILKENAFREDEDVY